MSEGPGAQVPDEGPTRHHPRDSIPPPPTSGSAELPPPLETPDVDGAPAPVQGIGRREPSRDATVDDGFAFAPSGDRTDRSQRPSPAAFDGAAKAGAEPISGARSPTRWKGRQARRRVEKDRPFWRELPLLIVLSLGLALLLKTFVVQAFFIPSPSMEPTLVGGDRVLVSKLSTRFGEVHRGDVIVFEDPDAVAVEDRGPISSFVRWLFEGLGVARPADEDFIKRVIALPGETWEIDKGVVSIDGHPIDEPYLDPDHDDRSFGPERVPQGMLFVLGDNRLQSFDSRFSDGLGYIPREKVVGKAFVIIWPPDRIGGL